MSWILYSILAALTWSIVNIIDKFIMTKWVKKPFVPVMMTGTVSFLVCILIFLFKDIPQVPLLYVGLAFLAGMVYIIANFLYFKAAKLEEISRIIPLLYLSPFFVLLLAAIFLGELFTPERYLGIFALMIGAMLISAKKRIQLSYGKAFWLIILAAFLFAIDTVVLKYLLQFIDFWTAFFYTRVGAFIAVLPAFYFRFSDFLAPIQQHGKRVGMVLFFNESMNVGAYFLFILALTTGYATLVNGLVSIQPFFVLLFTILISIWYPRILKEEIGKKTVLLKIMAIVLMVVGALLIT